MPTTRHIAEVTNPVTQETTSLTADTAEQLEQLVDEHFASWFPEPVEATGHREHSTRRDTATPPSRRCDLPGTQR